MKKYSIVFVFIAFVLTSCSSYQTFTSRKYYDYSRGEREINTPSGIKECRNIATTTIDGLNKEKTPVSSEIKIEPNSAVNENNSYSQRETEKGYSPVLLSGKAISSSVYPSSASRLNLNSISTVKFKALSLAAKEHVKGRLWWIWAIVAFVGFIIALFSSAYFGLFVMIGGMVMTIIGLLWLLKAKK
jgi:hypothetical protein